MSSVIHHLMSLFDHPAIIGVAAHVLFAAQYMEGKFFH